MNAIDIKDAIRRTMVEFPTYADELGDLDQALGDGDLGITVSLGAAAVIESLDQLTESATPTDVVLACAKAFANANPSTMAALVAGALLAGSRTWADLDDIDAERVAVFTRAAADSISSRGKSQVGDKTILDAMYPAAEALEAALPESGLDAAIDAAERGVLVSKDLQSRRGRASWIQERSIGLQDPGATAFWRFLQSWKAANAL
ncbi:DAK2 domain-containing protein [Microbacterium lacusdiani]